MSDESVPVEKTNANGQRPFRWNRKTTRAALLVAQDELTDRQIAAELKINVVTLERWKLRPEFRQRVEDLVEEFRKAILSQGIAVAANRVKAQHERWLGMQQIIRERAADPGMREIPGGGSGLLVRTAKLVKVYVVDADDEAGPKEGDPCPRCSQQEGCTATLQRAEVTNLSSGQKRSALACPLCMERWREEAEFLQPVKQAQVIYEYAFDAALVGELRKLEQHAAQELGQWLDRKDITSGGEPMKVYAGFDPDDV